MKKFDLLCCLNWLRQFFCKLQCMRVMFICCGARVAIDGDARRLNEVFNGSGVIAAALEMISESPCDARSLCSVTAYQPIADLPMQKHPVFADQIFIKNILVQ